MKNLSKLPIYIIEVVLGIMTLMLAIALFSGFFLISIIHLAVLFLMFTIIKYLKVSDSTKFSLKTISVFSIISSVTILMSGLWIISLPIVWIIASTVFLLVSVFAKINSEKSLK